MWCNFVVYIPPIYVNLAPNGRGRGRGRGVATHNVSESTSSNVSVVCLQ